MALIGNVISLQDIETGMRIISLAVPTAITVYAFIKNHKKRNEENM